MVRDTPSQRTILARKNAKSVTSRDVMRLDETPTKPLRAIPMQ